MASVLAEIDPKLLSGRREAEHVGVHEASVSRARKTDATHPAYQHPDGSYTDARTTSIRTGRGTVTLVHADAARTWWETHRQARRPATPPIPAGLTKTQWQALQALVATGTPPSRTTASRLTARGMLDSDGQPTPAARALVAPTPQEQQ